MEDIEQLQQCLNNIQHHNNDNMPKHHECLSKSRTDIIALCTCQQSKLYPLCDETHIRFNQATKSNITPLIVTLVDKTELPLTNVLKDGPTKDTHSTGSHL